MSINKYIYKSSLQHVFQCIYTWRMTWYAKVNYAHFVYVNDKMICSNLICKFNWYDDWFGKDSLLDFRILTSKCKNTVHSNTNYKISFVKRQTNQVAHYLARDSRLFASFKFF